MKNSIITKLSWAFIAINVAMYLFAASVHGQTDCVGASIVYTTTYGRIDKIEGQYWLCSTVLPNSKSSFYSGINYIYTYRYGASILPCDATVDGFIIEDGMVSFIYTDSEGEYYAIDYATPEEAVQYVHEEIYNWCDGTIHMSAVLMLRAIEEYMNQ